MRALNRCLALAAAFTIALSSGAKAQEGGKTNNRNGLWGGFGLGYGIIGVLECSSVFECDTEGGLSGNAHIGFTPSNSIRLAIGSNAWTKSEEGYNSNLGVYSAQVYFYPGEKDFFLLGGAGLALAGCTNCDTETGAGFLVGAGYDFPINSSGSLALTPYVNWLVTTLDYTPYLLQFGLGLTFN